MESPIQTPLLWHETLDGSPTLSEGSEMMHNRKGAFGETRHIYGAALQRALDFSPIPHVMSVGLGLGYGELLVASRLEEFRLTSFEKVSRLREGFLNWILGSSRDVELGAAYLQMVPHFEKSFSVTKEGIQSRLKRAYQDGRWSLHADIREAIPVHPFDVVFYDPYSSATNPELWESEFLNSFLRAHAGNRSVFATYAAKGALKRCLREAGFKVEALPGYGFKRESTIAFRA